MGCIFPVGKVSARSLSEGEKPEHKAMLCWASGGKGCALAAPGGGGRELASPACVLWEQRLPGHRGLMPRATGCLGRAPLGANTPTGSPHADAGSPGVAHQGPFPAPSGVGGDALHRGQERRRAILQVTPMSGTPPVSAPIPTEARVGFTGSGKPTRISRERRFLFCLALVGGQRPPRDWPVVAASGFPFPVTLPIPAR